MSTGDSLNFGAVVLAGMLTTNHVMARKYRIANNFDK